MRIPSIVRRFHFFLLAALIPAIAWGADKPLGIQKWSLSPHGSSVTWREKLQISNIEADPEKVDGVESAGFEIKGNGEDFGYLDVIGSFDDEVDLTPFQSLVFSYQVTGQSSQPISMEVILVGPTMKQQLRGACGEGLEADGKWHRVEVSLSSLRQAGGQEWDKADARSVYLLIHCGGKRTINVKMKLGGFKLTSGK